MTDGSASTQVDSADGPSVIRISEQDAVAYADLVAWLAARYPEISVTLIESIAQREAEAFLGGRHLAVPAALQDAVIEILSDRF